MNAIDKLKEYGVSLIITVDNGIVAIDEVKYAKSLGIDMVITDHHQPREELPQAVAVVDPHRKDCPSEFKSLAGVGVAFKLVMALDEDEGDFNTLLENYSDLVAIGTIGDIVPIKNENRFFVKNGMKYISHTDRVGLKALLEEAGIYGKSFSTGSVSFTIVPRINACGRMSSSDKAVQLLLSDYKDISDEIAASIGDENRFRQKAEQEIVKEVEELFKREPHRIYEQILVVEGENWHQGVIGIVASKITEKYGKPSIVISSSNGLSKGSGRSIEGFSLYDAVYACSEHLTMFGGHPMAAGLNLYSKDVEAFKASIENYAKNYGEIPAAKLKIDCKLNPKALSIDLINQISELEPFGFSNPKPMFVLSNMSLEKIQPVGGGKHLRLRFTRNDTAVTAMKFSITKEDFPYTVGDILDLAVSIDMNEYNGEKSLSIIIRDYKLSISDYESIIEFKRDFEKIKRGDINLKNSISLFIPSRNEFAEIYRYLRHNSGFKGTIDILQYRIGDTQINFGKMAVILDIMNECGLINLLIDGDDYAVNLKDVTGKVDLESSSLLKRLKSWRGEKHA